MLSHASLRFASVPLGSRVLQRKSYSSIPSNILLHRTQAHSVRVFPPLAPIQCPQQLLQRRLFAKNRGKKPSHYSPPSQSSHNKIPPQRHPLEPATIPTNSRAAAATEGGLDGTELPDGIDDISQSQARSEGLNGFSNETPQESVSASSSTNPADVYEQDVNSYQSNKPLPNLTQGIPSTIDAELSQSSSKSDPASLNITEDPSESDGRELPRSEYISSLEKRRNRVANYFYAVTLFGAIAGTIYLGRNWETDEEERKYRDAPNGWGIGLFFNRVSARLGGTLDYYHDPAFEKLLPNTDPMWERPYTLVLSLEDLLVHSDWDREHGWRMAKRPGVDYFLRYLSQYYELVIFTSVPAMTGQPIINKLDPYHIVMWPLFREATRYRKGEYVKDLSYLNRPEKKIILLDTDAAHAALQPENAIITKKWKGDPQDKELVSYIPFLEYIASMEFDDTRAVLKSFEGTHIPSEYARREGIAREKFMKQLAADNAKSGGRRSLSGLGSLLGVKSQTGSVDGSGQTLSESFAQGKMFQDQVRERGQKQYEMLAKEIAENGEKWLKEMAAEEKKANDEAIKGMKNSITGVFGPGGKAPPASPPSST